MNPYIEYKIVQWTNETVQELEDIFNSLSRDGWNFLKRIDEFTYLFTKVVFEEE